MTQAIPRVVDIYHGDVLASDVHGGDPVRDFRTLGGQGIWGVIHKATQGVGVADKTYAPRMRCARAAGLLTGAYHFNTGDSIPGQVSHFFDVAQPDAQTMMALDFEDNRLSQMSLAQAVQFLQLADEKLGRPLWVYSGNRIKSLIVNQSAEIRQTFAKRHFWLCEYGPTVRMVDDNHHQLPWIQPTLWQFTGDGIGPQPHALAGIITKGIDINSYAGTIDQLRHDWVS
jgi:lysozyme